uniref:Uncharacterized protein n=1 Tax=Rhizophora mucronata TaxID=61149 RepID=A0A2P2JE16_RHIMU
MSEYQEPGHHNDVVKINYAQYSQKKRNSSRCTMTASIYIYKARAHLYVCGQHLVHTLRK